MTSPLPSAIESAMRGSCSQQQKKKDLSAYDFNAEDPAVEEAAVKYSSRTGRLLQSSKSKSNPNPNPKEEERDEDMKYKFLQACKQFANFCSFRKLISEELKVMFY